MYLFYEKKYLIPAVLLIIIIVLIHNYYKRAFNYWKDKGVQTAPPTFPFGNARDLILQRLSMADLFENYYKIMRSQGLKYCGLYILTRPLFYVLDLDLLKTIMTKDFHHFTDRGLYFNEETDPISANLLTLPGASWRSRRLKLASTFTSGKIKIMFNSLLDCCKELIVLMDSIAESGEAFEVKDIMGRFTTDVVGSCAFGLECNSMKNSDSEFRKYADKALGHDISSQLRNTIATLLPEVMRTFKIHAINPEVSDFFINIVQKTFRYREENNVMRPDFMHLLMQLKNNAEIEKENNSGMITLDDPKNKTYLTEMEVTAEAFAIFSASYETSSSALTFCLYELAANLNIQEKVRKEVRETLSKCHGKVTYDTIAEMKYMDKCLSETFRKYPPVSTLVRMCTETYKVPNSNVTIQKGTTVAIPIGGIHHDPEYYPNPDKFDPERFSTENKLSRHNFTWIPFGEGPRICIGLRFGLMQIKAALLTLLQNYKFSLNSKTQVPLVMDPVRFFLFPKGGVWLNVEKIK